MPQSPMPSDVTSQPFQALRDQQAREFARQLACLHDRVIVTPIPADKVECYALSQRMLIPSRVTIRVHQKCSNCHKDFGFSYR